MTDRERTLHAMLESFNDLRDLLDRSGDIAYSGQHSSVMLVHSRLFTDSFRELERCLRAMRDLEPRLYHAVAERYLRSVRRMACVRRRAGKWLIGANQAVAGVPADVGYTEHFAKTWEGTVTLVTWNGGVDQERVQQGLEWLSEQFRGSPCLPDAMIGKERSAA